VDLIANGSLRLGQTIHQQAEHHDEAQNHCAQPHRVPKIHDTPQRMCTRTRKLLDSGPVQQALPTFGSSRAQTPTSDHFRAVTTSSQSYKYRNACKEAHHHSIFHN